MAPISITNTPALRPVMTNPPDESVVAANPFSTTVTRAPLIGSCVLWEATCPTKVRESAVRVSRPWARAGTTAAVPRQRKGRAATSAASGAGRDLVGIIEVRFGALARQCTVGAPGR